LKKRKRVPQNLQLTREIQEVIELNVLSPLFPLTTETILILWSIEETFNDTINDFISKGLNIMKKMVIKKHSTTDTR
jgi:hypothetical protein